MILNGERNHENEERYWRDIGREKRVHKQVEIFTRKSTFDDAECEAEYIVELVKVVLDSMDEGRK